MLTLCLVTSLLNSYGSCGKVPECKMMDINPKHVVIMGEKPVRCKNDEGINHLYYCRFQLKSGNIRYYQGSCQLLDLLINDHL